MKNNWIGGIWQGLVLTGMTGATITNNKICAPTPIVGNQAGNTFSNNTLLSQNCAAGYPGAPTIPAVSSTPAPTPTPAPNPTTPGGGVPAPGGVVTTPPVAPPGGVLVQVNPGTTYQTMTGWEVTARSWEQDKVNNRYNPSWKQWSPQVIDRLVNELGINRVRLEISSGAENPVDYWTQFMAGTISYTQLMSHAYDKINDNSNPAVINPSGFQFSKIDFYVDTVVLPMKQLLTARGEKLFINLNYVDFNTGIQGSLQHSANAAEYAEIIQATIDHLRTKYGIQPDSLEIVLEPDNTAGWGGTQIGQAAVSVTTRMTAAGYNLQIIAPSNADPAKVISYFNSMAQVPNALQKMTTLSYHRYGSTNYASLYTAAKARGLRTEMLEYIDGGIDQLLEDLTVAQASSWQKWGLAVTTLGNGHYYYEVDMSNPSAPKIAMEKATSLLSQYFRFVRMGARRIGSTSTNTAWTPVAFVNTNGKYVVVIKTAGSTSPVNTLITGLPAGNYGIRTTSFAYAATDLPSVTVAAGGLTVSIPAGVTTIYQK